MVYGGVRGDGICRGLRGLGLPVTAVALSPRGGRGILVVMVDYPAPKVTTRLGAVGREQSEGDTLGMPTMVLPDWFRDAWEFQQTTINEVAVGMRKAVALAEESLKRNARLEARVFGSNPPPLLPSDAPPAVMSHPPLTERTKEVETDVDKLQKTIVDLSAKVDANAQQTADVLAQQTKQTKALGLSTEEGAALATRIATFLFSQAGMKQMIQLMTLVCAALGLLAGMRTSRKLDPVTLAPVTVVGAPLDERGRLPASSSVAGVDGGPSFPAGSR